jgi:NitT/TauT family transport system substrate-binding protein
MRYFRLLNRGLVLGLVLLFGAAPALAQNVDVKKMDKLTVAYSASLPNLQDIQLFMARDAGIFQKYGLDVDIMSINGATPTFQALISGDADVAFIDPTQLLLAWEKGEHLRIIANTSPMQPYLLLANSSIKNIKDLTGKVIGISQPGTLSQTLVQMDLKKYGVDDRGVQWVSVGGSGPRYQALISKRIDAGIGQVDQGVRGAREGLVVVSDLGSEFPDLMGYPFAAKDTTIAAKRPAMVKFAAAMLEATRLVASNVNVATNYYLKYDKNATREDVAKEFQILRASKAWGPTGELRPAALAFTAQMMLADGSLKTAPSLTEIFDQSVLKDGAKLAATHK